MGIKTLKTKRNVSMTKFELEEVLFRTSTISLIPIKDEVIRDNYILDDELFCVVKVKCGDIDTLSLRKIRDLNQEDEGLVFILRDNKGKILLTSLPLKEDPSLVLPKEKTIYLSHYFDDSKSGFSWKSLIINLVFDNIKDILIENRLNFYIECKSDVHLLLMLRTHE
jgi:hypothetical protein